MASFFALDNSPALLRTASSSGSARLERVSSSMLAQQNSCMLRAPSKLQARNGPAHMPHLPARATPRRTTPTQAHAERFAAAAAAAAPSPSSSDSDPFVAAARRLQSLLSGVGDGESELVDSVLAEETPESRLQMQVVLGGLMTLVSVAVSMLCGQDPWGGAGFNLQSIMAAGVGAVAATPLVLFRLWTWSPAGGRALPQVEDMHLTQLALQAPWYARCNVWHVLTMCALEVLPVTLLLMPTLQGGMLAAVNMYSMMMAGGFGLDDSASDPALLQLTCLLVTSMVASVGKGLELGVSDQEYEVVQSAVDNADRYYRLMANQDGAPSAATNGAAKAALAFRSVAQAWMGARNDASLAAMGLCFADIMALGGMWYGTGNLAAPLTAALLINGVDAWHMHQTVLKREARAASTTTSKAGGMSKNAAKNNSNSKPPHTGWGA